MLKNMPGVSFTTPTSKSFRHLIPAFLRELASLHQERPDLVLAAWPALIGERFCSMTKAISFIDGCLTVQVRNSSLLNLLVQYEQKRLLQELRTQFPHVAIYHIRFVIG